MKKFLLVSLGAALLAACGEDADVTENETPVVTDAADTAPEIIESDAPAGPNASWDANNDQMIDRNEFTGMGDRGFLGWDGDNDQRLSQTEFESGWTEAGFQNGGEVFTAFDDNSDSFLDGGEFFSEDEFAEWDTNSNGILEQNEFGYYRGV